MQLIHLALLSLFGLAAAAPSSSIEKRGVNTSVKIVNNCKFTIKLGQLSSNQPPVPTVSLASGQSKTYKYAGTWSGRFWARKNCNGGDCPIAGAAYPASLAEFTFNADAGKDFYDLSFVDGYNLPVSITPVNPTKNVGSGDKKYWCGAPTCSITPVCPPELQFTGNAGDNACLSACSKFGNPEYCCSGAFNTPDKCPINKYAAIIKKACPDAYSYAYDDKDSTFTCIAPAYTVTWCPNKK